MVDVMFALMITLSVGKPTHILICELVLVTEKDSGDLLLSIPSSETEMQVGTLAHERGGACEPVGC